MRFGGAITGFFLRAKHWQIFILLFAWPTIADFAAAGHIPARLCSWHDLGTFGFVYLSTMELYLLCFLGWYASMGLFFHSLVKLELRMSTGFFCFALFYPAIYALIFFPVVMMHDSQFLTRFVLLPAHLICMVCIIYVFYFVSKCLMLAQTGRPVSFGEFARPFFLLWFIPIGIWIIQPQVNKLFAQPRTTTMFSQTSAG